MKELTLGTLRGKAPRVTSAKELMGEEAAAGMLAHANEIKVAGAKYCDCAACTATHELLAKHGRPVE